MIDEIQPSLLPELNEQWRQTLNWQPTSQQQQQFQRLYELILEGNRHLNLTRITDPLDFWEKHLWDSLRGMSGNETVNLSVLSQQPEPLRAIDIGTGAGFPGLPVAIALPNLTVTLLDSTRKKITFVDSLLSALPITNANTLLGRAEEINKQPAHRGVYDLAVLRAVASASDCAKYALPFLKTGGLAILYRGHWTTEEEETLQSCLQRLNGKLQLVEAFQTPLTQSVRHCIYLQKTA
ncbi:MAG: 16S rRNA (guanine(527)-N(7))-methyltransferase RsmG [Actinomycetota bacterium]